MRMNTQTRYSLRALLELARCHGGPPVPMSTLARDERLSRKYLHALLTDLKSAGLVRSIRGVTGGFVLARDPAEIRLSEVYHAVEGPVSLVDCVTDTDACDRSTGCTARQVWQELSDGIENLLENITLESLITPEKKTRSKSASGKRRTSKAKRTTRGASKPRRPSDRNRSKPRNR